MSKLSDWQDGVPSIEGIYQIYVPEHISSNFNGVYFARFKDGEWDVGNRLLDSKLNTYTHIPYNFNNDPDNPRKWRGVIDE